MRLSQSRRRPANRRDPGSTPLDPKELGILLLLALGCAWYPIDTWHTEHYLTRRVGQLLESPRVRVQCKMFDLKFGTQVMGYAKVATGEIVLERKYCQRIMSYRAHPRRADEDELSALNALTHEAMHLRGELNEAMANCQAVQRNAQMAQLLGVPPAVARQNARNYYFNVYRYRSANGYFSDECAPGKALDERLDESIWAASGATDLNR